MFRSALPYAQAAGIEEPVVCYQGAAVVEPAIGRVPAPRADPARAGPRGDRGRPGGRLRAQLLRRRRPLRRRDHAERPRVRRLPAHPDHTRSATCSAWLERPPTKLVVVDDPDDARRAAADARRAFGGRLFIAKSLPFFLELASPDLEGQRAGVPGGAPRLHGRADGRLRRRRERPRAARVGGLRRLRRERQRRR